MKQSLAAGLTTTARIAIDAGRTIDFMGDEGRVYATPELVRDVEMTCRDLLLAHLDVGEDSVGTRVEIDHVGATLLGMHVEITVTVSAVNGRAVSFDVSARDEVEEVARGKHNRFVIDVAKTAERLKGKAAKAGL